MLVQAMAHSQPLHILIEQDIVDVIIGDMMFHPEDVDGVSCTRLLTSFVTTLHSSEKADAKKLSWYAINVSNSKQFLLIVQYLAAGLSFCQVNRVLAGTKELLGVGSIGSCYEGIISRYAHFFCAMSLQCIAELLHTCWAFSVSLDMATHMATGYCYVHIRFCHKWAVHNFHLLPIPVHDRKTGEIIFNTYSEAMDALTHSRVQR